MASRSRSGSSRDEETIRAVPTKRPSAEAITTSETVSDTPRLGAASEAVMTTPPTPGQSGTPRTDTLKIPSEAMLLLGQKGVPEKIVQAILALGDHARNLEREGNDLRAALEAIREERLLARGAALEEAAKVCVEMARDVPATLPDNPVEREKVGATAAITAALTLAAAIRAIAAGREGEK